MLLFQGGIELQSGNIEQYLNASDNSSGQLRPAQARTLLAGLDERHCQTKRILLRFPVKSAADSGGWYGGCQEAM